MPFSMGRGAYRNGPGRRLRQGSTQAFTLIELMIVVAILALLLSVAIPRYELARSSALIGTKIGELVDYAKACTVINASGTGGTPTPAPLHPERGGVQITQGCSGENQGATLQASWGSARASGIPCLNSRSTITSSKATVTLTAQRQLICSFED